ncbi:MAG TPA: hypothetical protein DCS48_09555 [Desulfovibrio sp.]|nr:hypothetical protein [Desulfovibrio sp.]
MIDTLAQGIFSSRTGDDDIFRDDTQKSYWSVQELESGSVEVQALNSNNIPAGPKLTINRERFMANYNPEPEFYANVVLPSVQAQNERIQRGEGHRHKDEVYSAEYEFSEAVAVDEENVRANFGLGLTYLERGEVERAENVFKRLVRLNAIYAPEHKHLFNEFGISMRKNGMFEHAIKYYHRAEEICDDDENLFLNISRAYFEKGDLNGCVKYLEKSLILNQDFDEAGLFRDFLLVNGFMNNDAEPAISSDDLEKYHEKVPELRNGGFGYGKVTKDEFPEFSETNNGDGQKIKKPVGPIKLDF